ncbi:MAG: hypothetical protein JWO31_3787 [Phycisphaerales bacterium]|nr:hypothetical protein [Phycisphaerales bacterium]
MGLLDQLGSALGGQPSGGGGGGGSPVAGVLGRILGGNHDAQNPASPDGQQFGQMIQQVPRDQLAGVFGQAARGMDGQAYRDHVTPGAGGTNPLGMLKGPAMAMVAGALMKHLTGGGQQAGGLSGMVSSALGGGGGAMGGGISGGGAAGGMGGLGGLLGMVPGLQTTDPHQMDEHQVAALADYARQHHPDAFGQAMADVGHQNPSALGALLGNGGLSSVAQQLGGLLGGGR